MLNPDRGDLLNSSPDFSPPPFGPPGGSIVLCRAFLNVDFHGRPKLLKRQTVDRYRAAHIIDAPTFVEMCTE